MQQTISGKLFINLLGTLGVSYIIGVDLCLGGYAWHIKNICEMYSIHRFARVKYEPFYVFNKLSSYSASPTSVRYYSTMNNNKSNTPYQVNPYFVAGFCDAEGSFMLFLNENITYKTGVKVELTFAIVLHKKDLALLEAIRSSLGGIGRISRVRGDAVQFRVRKLEDLKILINFFDKYHLITQKLGDYQLFKQAFEIYSSKLHLTTAGLEKLVAIKSSMNRRGIPLGNHLAKAFSLVESVPRPLVVNKKIEDSN
jgi:hypothetical protein